MSVRNLKHCSVFSQSEDSLQRWLVPSQVRFGSHEEQGRGMENRFACYAISLSLKRQIIYHKAGSCSNDMGKKIKKNRIQESFASFRKVPESSTALSHRV